jgi:hypothetical protein
MQTKNIALADDVLVRVREQAEAEGKTADELANELLGPLMELRTQADEEEGLANLRKQLREGAQVRAERDLHLAEEWFALDEDEEVQPGARR